MLHSSLFRLLFFCRKLMISYLVSEFAYDLSSGEDHSVETKYKANENGSVDFIDCRWDDESWMKREVNETQEKWKETLPKHITRIKLRNSRKLRNKRKGKK